MVLYSQTATPTPNRDTAMSNYISAANTAKMVRAALKAAFPATKFTVRTSSYSMGASVNVQWTDGPTADRVDEVVHVFNGNGFDGSIDMGYSIQAWMLNGEVIGTRCTGTEGSRGVVAAWGMIAPHDDAELVHFGASVRTARTVSAALANRCIAQVVHYYGMKTAPVALDGSFGYKLENAPRNTGTGHDWDTLIYRASRDRTTYQRGV